MVQVEATGQCLLFFRDCRMSLIQSVYLFSGNETLNQVITVLLSTGMFVGGVIGFFFDNTIPGNF